jgi:hypothetical protein
MKYIATKLTKLTKLLPDKTHVEIAIPERYSITVPNTYIEDGLGNVSWVNIFGQTVYIDRNDFICVPHTYTQNRVDITKSRMEFLLVNENNAGVRINPNELLFLHYLKEQIAPLVKRKTASYVDILIEQYFESNISSIYQNTVYKTSFCIDYDLAALIKLDVISFKLWNRKRKIKNINNN